MNKHIGSDFDDFLSEQGLLDEASVAAIKRVTDWKQAEDTETLRTAKASERRDPQRRIRQSD